MVCSKSTLLSLYLVYNIVARLKRWMDGVKYTGPITVAADCTKVCPHLVFFSNFGSHILGSTWNWTRFGLMSRRILIPSAFLSTRCGRRHAANGYWDGNIYI